MEPEGPPVAAGKAREQRAPRRITADYLQRAAMHYLERYAAPSAQLRRVLQRKVILSCRHHGGEASHFDGMLDEIVARCQASGLVDDQAFAQARAASLRRKGHSARGVAARLSAKGVERELVEQHSRADEDQERNAARIAARRKQLGPWARGDRVAKRQKDLAALLRMGFGINIARAVIDGAGDDENL